MKRQPGFAVVSPLLRASSATALLSPHNLGMFRANKGSPSTGTGNAHFFINRLRKLCLRGMDGAHSIPAHHPEDSELSESLRGALSGVKVSGHFLWLTAFRATPTRDVCSSPHPPPQGGGFPVDSPLGHVGAAQTPLIRIPARVGRGRRWASVRGLVIDEVSVGGQLGFQHLRSKTVAGSALGNSGVDPTVGLGMEGKPSFSTHSSQMSQDSPRLSAGGPPQCSVLISVRQA